MQTDSAQEFTAEWQSWTPGRPLPDAFTFVEARPSMALREEVDIFLFDLRMRYENGFPRPLDEYVSARPQLTSDEGIVLDLIAGEFNLRREFGGSPTVEEYLAQYPRLSKQLCEVLPSPSSGGERAQGNETATMGRALQATVSDGDVRVRRMADIDKLLDKLDRYDVVARLGAGAMGEVYRAHDTQLKRDVALKVPKLGHDPDGRERQRFLREARVAASLRDAHICPVFDVGEVDEYPYLAMAFIDGEPLSSHVGPKQRMDAHLAANLIAKLAKALQKAHDKGIVHRDLKPSNIMLDGDGEPIVMDFGLAQHSEHVGPKLTRVGGMVGSPAYMSPEQIDGIADLIGPAADQYSLGITFYELLTGERPFRAEKVSDLLARIVTESPRPPCEICPAIGSELQNICLRMIAKDAEQRFGSMGEVQQALTAWLAGQRSGTARRERLKSVNDPAESRGFEGGGSSAVGPFFLRRSTLIAGIALVCVAFAGFSGLGGFSAVESWFDSSVAVQGDTPDSITFGSTTSMSGMNRDVGQAFVQGLRAAFEEANAAGGVHRRKLELVVLDDGNQPERALANAQELLEEREVFGIVGNVGTPTAEVAAPYAVEQRRLFFAPISGARFLRQRPAERYVFNVRASTADETAALVRYFVETEDVLPERIAVFAQDDSYGDDGFRGVARALRAYGVEEESILRVGHARNTIRVDEAVETIADDRDHVSAIVMVSTHGATAQFVKGVRDAGVDAELGAVSFVGSNLLAERFREIGPKYGDGVIVTEVVPSPLSNATGVIRYREALAKYVPEARPGSVSLEGYIAGRCLIEGLRRAGPNLDAETLVDALEDIRYLDLGIGTEISFTPSDHQASHKVWAIQFDGHGKYRSLDLVDSNAR